MLNKNKTFELCVIWGLMGLLILGVVALSYTADAKNKKLLQSLFERRQSETIEEIRSSIERYEELFRSGRGLFSASDYVSKEEWRAFVDSVSIEKHFPGMHSFAYADVVYDENLEGYIEQIEKEEFSDFKIRPDGQRDLYVVHRYYYPESEYNQNAVGFDLWSAPARREAMTLAAKNNEAVISQNIQLSEKNVGFLMFLPVYKKHSPAKSSIDQVKGFVFGTFRIKDVLDPIDDHFPRMKIELFDSDIADQEQKIYESNIKEEVLEKPRRFKELQNDYTIIVDGHAWTIRFKTLPDFGREIGRYRPVFIVIIGIIISAFAFVSMWALRRSKIHAELVASERVRDLKESQQKLSSILDNTLDGLVTIDEKGVILSFNKACTAIFGYSPNEVIGKNIKILMPSPYKDQHDRYLSNYKQTGKTNVLGRARELQGQRKDGEIFPIELSANPATVGDKTVFIGIVRDITLRKAHEDELIAANAELEEFSYRTSHDLRSPLVSASGLLRVIEKCINSGNNEKALESLHMALSSLTALEMLVGDILVLTRAKNEQEDTQDVDVNAVVHEAIEKMSCMEGFDRLDVRYDLQYTEVLTTQKSRFVLIVENLISNAIKYQDPEQDLSYIKVTTAETDDCFVVSVEDNGLGIPENQIEKLFTMFKRFHPKVAFGSGLGLYMIKKSADVLGAEISFEDNEPGCVFRLSIPLNQTTHEERKIS